MSITFPTNTEDIIDEIRVAIGRDVDFYQLVSTECTECSLDPITDTSTNSFCPTCSGLYYINTVSGTTISGHVTWGNVDTLGWFPGGQVFDGDCRVQIKYTLDNLSTVKNSEYMVVDDIQLRIDDYALRGVKNLNRIVITTSQEERS